MTFSAIFKKFHRAFDLCPYGKKELFRVDLFERAEDIPASMQAELDAQPDVFLTMDYLRSMEHSRPDDLRFIYTCVSRDKKPAAFLYFQLLTVRFDQADGFLNPHYFRAALERLRTGAGNPLLRNMLGKPASILFCGNIFLSGQHGIYVCRSPFMPETTASLPQLITEATEKATESLRLAGVVVKDFPEDGFPGTEKMEAEGFRKFHFEPDMVMAADPSWTCFDDYLEDLSSKYRVRARNVLKRAGALTDADLNERQIRSHAAEINILYRNVHRKSAVHFSGLDATYFQSLKKKLGDDFSFRGFFLEGNLVAFSTAVFSGKAMEAHLVGMDYAYNKSHALYPYLLYDYIRQGIARQVKMIRFGRTALEIKSTVGAKPEPLHCYIALRKPLSMRLLQPFFESSYEPDLIPRDPFREKSTAKAAG